jgi:hypothetical protein
MLRRSDQCCKNTTSRAEQAASGTSVQSMLHFVAQAWIEFRQSENAHQAATLLATSEAFIMRDRRAFIRSCDTLLPLSAEHAEYSSCCVHS